MKHVNIICSILKEVTYVLLYLRTVNLLYSTCIDIRLHGSWKIGWNYVTWERNNLHVWSVDSSKENLVNLSQQGEKDRVSSLCSQEHMMFYSAPHKLDHLCSFRKSDIRTMVDIQVTFLLCPEDGDRRFLRKDGTFACNRLLYLTSQKDPNLNLVSCPKTHRS